MHIEINIFPNSFSINPTDWQNAIFDVQHRISSHILKATVHSDSGTLGKQTLLDNDGMIIATIDIRRD